jgi:hypothetical protein
MSGGVETATGFPAMSGASGRATGAKIVSSIERSKTGPTWISPFPVCVRTNPKSKPCRNAAHSHSHAPVSFNRMDWRRAHNQIAVYAERTCGRRCCDWPV